MIKEMEYPERATPLDADEMEGLKFPHVTTRGELDHLEQANIAAGLLWLNRRKGSDILNEQFVRSLHRRLLGEVWRWAGTYRHTEKNIGVDPRQINVQLRDLLDDVLYWVENGTYNPIESAVRFHHRMVFIHPFPNGNGRHARIMADALLEKVHKVQAIDWAGGEDLQRMNDRREQYIAALRAADGGDYGPLLIFVGRE
jgi:Fic-DOC domain mobile mystery protein B